MVSLTTLIQILIGFLGFASAASAFWIGKTLEWSDELEVIVALLIGGGTILVELIISFHSVKNSIEKLYPALELSVQEQRNINDAIVLNNALKQKKESPAALIALEHYKEAGLVLRNAFEGNDFTINDLYSANLLALSSLRPGQRFCGVSALIKPELWKYGKEMTDYRNINYSQAQNGVLIDRIFIFSDENELRIMKDLLDEQHDNKINVYYVFKKQLAGRTFYPDFTVIEQLSFGIVVHRSDMLEKVTVTKNPQTIGELLSQFNTLLEFATKYTPSETAV
ncbi:MAG: hypothetical protein OER77_00220 [Myxococcales bacterium]|nr:hypothetical protein [Myxococcales bacterium]